MFHGAHHSILSNAKRVQFLTNRIALTEDTRRKQLTGPNHDLCDCGAMNKITNRKTVVQHKVRRYNATGRLVCHYFNHMRPNFRCDRLYLASRLHDLLVHPECLQIISPKHAV